MMRRLTLLLLCAICGQPFAGGAPDRATTVRATVLRDAPARASTVIRELAANVELDVFDRERLWVKAAPEGAGEAEAGWLRFTEVRYRATAAPAAAKSTQPAEAGGFAGFSRSVSGFLRGFGSRSSNSPRLRRRSGSADSPSPTSKPRIRTRMRSRWSTAIRFPKPMPNSSPGSAD